MINDEIKAQTRKLKQMSAREKASYIYDYYKWHILGSVLALAVLISVLAGFLTAKEPVFCVTMVNSYLTDPSQSTLLSDFSEAMPDFDPSREKMVMECGIWMDPKALDALTVGYDQKLVASFTAGTIDVMLADKDIIEKYAPFGVFEDLGQLLDDSLLQELKEGGYELLSYEIDPSVSEVPSPSAAGLCLTQSPVLSEGFESPSGHSPYFNTEDGHLPVLAIPRSSTHKDASVDFVRYLIRSNGWHPQPTTPQ